MPRTSRNPRDIDVGRRVRTQRLQRGMSQTKLANYLGVSFQQIQKYENGTNRIAAGRLEQISKALDAPLTFFYGVSDSKKSTEELMGFLDTANALRLVNAFTRIRDPHLQRALVLLLEQVAPKS